MIRWLRLQDGKRVTVLAALFMVPVAFAGIGSPAQAQSSPAPRQLDLTSPGLSVAPLYLEITSREGIAAATLRVDNTTEDDLPIEISIKRRVFDAYGIESSVDDDEAFLVFPPQLVLPAKQSQAIRLQYLSDKPLTQTEHFYVVVSRVPVDFDEGFNTGLGIRLSVQFAVTVNVSPSGATPEVQVTSVADSLVSYDESSEDEPVIEAGETISEPIASEVMGLPVTFVNSGTRTIYLSQSQVRVTDGSGETFLLRPNEIRRKVGDSIVPAGSQRTYSLPLPASATGPFAVDIR